MKPEGNRFSQPEPAIQGSNPSAIAQLTASRSTPRLFPTNTRPREGVATGLWKRSQSVACSATTTGVLVNSRIRFASSREATAIRSCESNSLLSTSNG